MTSPRICRYCMEAYWSVGRRITSPCVRIATSRPTNCSSRRTALAGRISPRGTEVTPASGCAVSRAAIITARLATRLVSLALLAASLATSDAPILARFSRAAINAVNAGTAVYGPAAISGGLSGPFTCLETTCGSILSRVAHHKGLVDGLARSGTVNCSDRGRRLAAVILAPSRRTSTTA